MLCRVQDPSSHAGRVSCCTSFAGSLPGLLLGFRPKSQLRGPRNEICSCCFYFKEQKNQQTRNQNKQLVEKLRLHSAKRKEQAK